MSDRAETTVPPPVPADPWHSHPLREEVERLRERLHSLRKLVDAQAEDDGLWAIYPMGVQPVVEAYLQQELRRLHAAVEACWPEGFLYCDECTKELDVDGDCFECGTGKHAEDCKCGKGDWLCPWHHRNEPCRGAGEET